jgi:hypothetical protein
MSVDALHRRLRDGELLLELAGDIEREGCPCGQRLPPCEHLDALARAAEFCFRAPVRLELEEVDE